MNQQIAKQWVAALRSGKYKQGRGQLRTEDNEYCCLGVLCDISNLGEWTSSNWYLDERGSLPKKVMDRADIQNSCGHIPSLNTSLTDLNDSGSTFEGIADIIEKHWKKI